MNIKHFFFSVLTLSAVLHSANCLADIDSAAMCRGEFFSRDEIVWTGDVNFVGTDGPDYVMVESNAIIDTKGGNDVVCVVDGFSPVVRLGDGNDRYISLNVNDRVDGGNGDDVIVVNSGADTVFGGPGNDTIASEQIKAVPSASDNFFGGPGDDRIYASSEGGGVVSGDDGDDMITVLDGNWRVMGGTGNDRIFFDGTGSDFIDGGDGNDTIQSQFQDIAVDTVFGGRGTDTFSLCPAFRVFPGPQSQSNLFEGDRLTTKTCPTKVIR